MAAKVAVAGVWTALGVVVGDGDFDVGGALL